MNVYSSMNFVSYWQLMYLLAAAFLVATAFGSDEVERSSKREGSHIIYEELIKLKREFDTLKNTVKAAELTKGGAVYIRWGRNVCPSGSDALYRGVAGGTLYAHSGGGSNYLCLPLDPIWGAYNTGVERHSDLYGSEYQVPTGFGLNNNHFLPLHDNNVPCVVCRSQTKTTVIMIPARNQCYAGMQTEYTGYLMSAGNAHSGRTEFTCVDGQPESVLHGFRNEDGALFYNVKGVCGSLPCPPYVTNREITCAVCTK